jgi:ferredoxin
MAYGIEDGPPVLLDRQKCNGCRMCELVCPFGVVEISRDGKAMIKCDLCIERTRAGEEPACVAACPTGALRFVDVDVDGDVRRRRREMAALAAADPQGRAEERPPRPRGAARGAGAWNAKLALAACRSCGRPFGPGKVLAFLHRKLPGTRPEMEVCPACRRARTAEQLARNSGLPLVEEAGVEVLPVGARGKNERSTCPEK